MQANIQHPKIIIIACIADIGGVFQQDVEDDWAFGVCSFFLRLEQIKNLQSQSSQSQICVL